jgi:predicted glycogen debranching enzyme
VGFCYPKNKDLTFTKASSLEWLETNGLGGYSSGTVANCNTRKYHGLLVSKLDGLANKYVLLNTIEDIFIYNNQKYFLTAHNYPNYLQDGSFTNLEEFILNTNPVWRFKFNNLVLTKEIILLQEENTVLLKYTINGGDKNCKLELRPLLACRNFHNLQQENSFLQRETKRFATGFSCISYADLPVLFFQTNAKHKFFPQTIWYRNFIYKLEQERGYDFQEDLFSPGVITFADFAAEREEQEIIFSCSLKEQDDLLLTWKKEIKQRVRKNSSNANELQQQLQLTSQSFITKNNTIVAGYHWFLEWGRDAMISLPGLTLYSGKEELCLEILKKFAAQEHNGLIPNYLGNTKEENAYNSVDASLWFGWAVQQYYLKTKKILVIEKYFWSVFKNIFAFYKNGTLYHIKMQKNGLLYSGSKEENLTWMDAVVNNNPVTPRYGFQVEVNALWFNMLKFMYELAVLLKDDAIIDELKELLPLVQKEFCDVFWCEEKKYLYDFVNSEQKNSALRPNQIFAVSLPYSPLILKMGVSIMSAVRKNLLTPYGLRTLAPSDIAYKGSYYGSQVERDLAYHNGTVWPWLLGHFTEGLLRVTANYGKVREIVKPCLNALQSHLTEYGIGSISEVFSGDYPHQPNGCISQAWSVAEVLRVTYLLGLSN